MDELWSWNNIIDDITNTEQAPSDKYTNSNTYTNTDMCTPPPTDY